MKKLWIIVKCVCGGVTGVCGGYGAATLACQAKTKLGKILSWCTLVPASLIGSYYIGSSVVGQAAEEWLETEEEISEEEPEDE